MGHGVFCRGRPKMTRLAFFLEEDSARAFLQSFLPRVLPDVSNASVRYFVYRGKQDLQNNIIKDLRRFRNSHSQQIVLVDQDYADCHHLKAKLHNMCAASGATAVIRIACRELESWYLAQLDVVAKEYALPKIAALQGKKKFRKPDILATPDILLKKLTHNQYAKIDGSRRLGSRLNPDACASPSFVVFIAAIRKAAESSGKA